MSIVEKLGFAANEIREKVTFELLEKLSSLDNEEMEISELSIIFTGSNAELEEIIKKSPISPLVLVQRQINEDASPFLLSNTKYGMCTIGNSGVCIGQEHIAIKAEDLVSAPFFFTVKSEAAWNLLVGTADTITSSFKAKLRNMGKCTTKKEDFLVGDLLTFKEADFCICNTITDNQPCIVLEKFPEGAEIIHHLRSFLRKCDLMIGFYDENGFFDTTVVESWRMKKID